MSGVELEEFDRRLDGGKVAYRHFKLPWIGEHAAMTAVVMRTFVEGKAGDDVDVPLVKVGLALCNPASPLGTSFRRETGRKIAVAHMMANGNSHDVEVGGEVIRVSGSQKATIVEETTIEGCVKKAVAVLYDRRRLPTWFTRWCRRTVEGKTVVRRDRPDRGETFSDVLWVMLSLEKDRTLEERKQPLEGEDGKAEEVAQPAGAEPAVC